MCECVKVHFTIYFVCVCVCVCVSVCKSISLFALCVCVCVWAGVLFRITGPGSPGVLREGGAECRERDGRKRVGAGQEQGEG